MTHPRLNILVAYPYLKPAVLERLADLAPEDRRLMVDSGAFSAWNSGKEIRLDDYCRFLDSIEHLRPFKAVQLDVIGDPEATWRNFVTMQDRGYDVIPVWTRGDSPEQLEAMYQRTDYVMLGGVAKAPDQQSVVRYFGKLSKGRKAHWLGVVRSEYLKAYRPTSVDSNSWKDFLYGALSVYMGFGKITRIKKQRFQVAPGLALYNRIRRVGGDDAMIQRLQNNRAWQTVHTINENALEGTAAMVCALSHIFRAWEVERNLGTEVYLACINWWEVSRLIYAYHLQRERGVYD